LRYPVFGVGQPPEVSPLPPLQWISEKAVEL
jgi:hypothetical protein